MLIFQPDRYLLKIQVKKYSHFINGKVLDIGAGEFSRYQNLFRYIEYIKMDINDSSNIDVVGSADDIPFPNNTFDSVICTQVFEHLKNPNTAAKEIYRVLKNGGHLLITVPQTNELHEEPNDFFRYTNFGISEIFREIGFRLIAYEQRGGFFTTISQLQIRYLIDRLNLYQRAILGRIFNIFIRLYASIMIWFDKIDKSQANKKHTLGWIFIFQK